MKNIQVIGASGYIGRAICGALLHKYNVTALSRSMPSFLNNDELSFIPFDYVQKIDFNPRVQNSNYSQKPESIPKIYYKIKSSFFGRKTIEWFLSPNELKQN